MTAIRVELQLADGSFTSGILRAGQSMAQFNQQLIKSNPALAQIAANGGNVVASMSRADGATKGFLGTMRDLSIVAGVASMGLSKAMGVANSWVGDIVRVNAEMERLKFEMQGMSTASDPIKDAANNVTYLREQALKMPFSLKAITNSFVKLKSTGTDPMNGSLKALTDGVAAFGGGDDALNRIVLGVSQMSGKGVIQMEEMRQQLAEAMPRAMELMARSMGVSMGDFVKEIGKGTVDAKSALNSFYGEIERTFGGRAEYMMQSFSGQISRLHTSLQILATGEGLGAADGQGISFFNEVKSQLTDLNDFIASDMAKAIAQDLGKALSSAVDSFRSVIDFTIKFRNEIGDLAAILGTGLGINVAVSALGSLTGALTRSVLAMTAAKVSFSGAMTWFEGTATAMRSSSTALTGVQMALNGVGRAAMAAGSMFAAALPWVSLLAAAVYMAGSYFGYFSDKVDDAYESLKKYGAESRKQAVEIIQSKEDQLNNEAAIYEARIRQNKDMQEQLKKDPGLAFSMGESAALMAKDAADAEKKLVELYGGLNELNAARAKQIKDATRREDEIAVRDFERDMADKLAIVNKSYDEEQTALSAALVKERQARIDAGQGVSDLDEQNKKDIIASREKQAAAVLKIVEDEITENAKLQKSGDEYERRRAGVIDAWLQERRSKAIENQRNIQGESIGIKHLDKAPDPKKDIDRGTKLVESLTDDVAKLKAELTGASGAYAEMQSRIARGDFSNIADGGEAVRKMHEDLLALAHDKEVLDKLTKGQNKADNDIENARVRLLEREIAAKEKLAGRTLTEGEKIQLKLDSGYYDGLGPVESIKKVLGSITTTFNLQKDAAAQVATTMKNDTFGEDTVVRVNAVTTSMHKLLSEIRGVGENLGNVSFADFGRGLRDSFTGALDPVVDKMPQDVATRMKMAMDHLMSKGWSKTVAAGVVGNLVAESGMNPSAIGDGGNSIGLAQHNKTRADAMKSYLDANGKQWDDFYGQLDFIDHELRTKFSGVASKAGMAPSPEGSANTLMNGYEKPSDWAAIESARRRQGAARQAYDMTPEAIPALKPVEGLADDNALLLDRVKYTKELGTETAKLTDRERQTTIPNEQAASRAELLKDLTERTKNASVSVDELGSNYAALVKEISAGKLGSSTDINAKEYKDLIAAAKELDSTERDIALVKKARSESDRQIKEIEAQRLEINRRIGEETKRAANPDYQPRSEEYRRLNVDLELYLTNMKRVYGAESAAYLNAVATRDAVLKEMLRQESVEKTANFAKENRDFQDSLLNQTQLRKVQFDRGMEMIAVREQEMRDAGESEVNITREIEARKQKLRAETIEKETPLQAQLKQWGDLQTNLEQGAAHWTDTLSSGIADLAMGTGDLRSTINSILKDVMNMLVKLAMSGLMGGKGGGSSKGGASAGKGISSALASFSMAHTGGIIGSSNLQSKTANAAAFINAPKFHTGGIIGGMKLRHDEVPIIAKKKEGVFTPEQMDAMGGFSSSNVFQINAPVTVNANGGTPEQNEDLARKMAREMEGNMRGIVASELQKQQRPGNMMNTRSR